MKRRPFGLTDAMLFVAAVAAGLWANRGEWPPSFPWSRVNSYDSIEYLLKLVLPHVAALTVALVAIQMRKPRPVARRLSRAPGAAACMVASAVLLVIALWAATTRATGRVVEFEQHVSVIPNRGGRGSGGNLILPVEVRWLTVYGDRVGFAVAGAWLALLLAGRWRPEATWIDRLGWSLGWLWLSLTVVLWFRSLLI
jgi:hypothetical protein